MADQTVVVTEALINTVDVYDPTLGMKYTDNVKNPFNKGEATAATIESIAAIEGMTQIQLLWTQTDEPDHEYTEIFRADTDNISASRLVGTASGTAFTDPVSAGVTYYYWLRPIGFNKVPGQVSQAHVATSGRNPEQFAAALGKALTADNLSDDVQAAIKDIIDSTTSNTLLALQDNIASLNIDFANVSNLASLINTINTLRTDLENEDAITRALIEEQKQLLITNETALTQQVTTLAASVETEAATREALLEEERTLRANDYAVTAAELNNLSAELTTETETRIAAVFNEQLARANDIAVVAEEITELTTSLSTATATLDAAISSESQLRASEDEVIATQINSLNSALDDAITNIEASITSESLTRASDIAALASTVESYKSSIDDNTASLSVVAGTLVNVDSSISTLGTSLSTAEKDLSDSITAVSGDVSTVSSNLDTLTTNVQAEYAIKTDVNGRVAGIGLINNGDSSLFEIVADNFAVLDPDDVTNVVLGVSGGKTVIDGAFIKDASIDSASIASLDAGKISATTLSAIRADMGEITAGKLSGPNGRFVLDLTNNKLQVFDAAGTLRVQLGDLG